MSLLGLIIALLLALIAVLFIPCLIVGFWKSRPAWAFIVAAMVMFVTLTAPVLLQVMIEYDEGNPHLVAGLVRQAIFGTILSMIVCLPLLAVFQWFVLRRHRRKVPKVDADKTFS